MSKQVNNKSSMVDRYSVKLMFTRSILATNPIDPNVHDKHILERRHADGLQVTARLLHFLLKLKFKCVREDFGPIGFARFLSLQSTIKDFVQRVEDGPNK